MKLIRNVSLLFSLIVVSGLLFVWHSIVETQRDINEFQEKIKSIASENTSRKEQTQDYTALPKPVQRYFNFVFPGPVEPYSVVVLSAQGAFRLPLKETFNPMQADQVIAITTPALMFSAKTDITPFFWATAYDFYAQGRMEMKAKILSTITVVDEKETQQLNQISLRRWLLESALYPQALLPSKHVTWQAIDQNRARVIVSANGLQSSLVASFNEKGEMTSMTAEKEGDLSTPYHGSGEYVSRSDYRQVGNQMIPHKFTIARMANKQIYPFWKGEIKTIKFEK